MKKYFVNTGVMIAASFFVFSCTDTNEKVTTKSDTMILENRDNNSSLSMQDSGMMNNDNADLTSNDFVSKAAEGGMMEVALGKMAQANGNSSEVKEFGKMLEKDHSEATDELMAIAKSEKIKIPTGMTSEQTSHMTEMENMKGAAFDKAFVNMMVDDHQKDIAAFKAAAASNENENVKKFASNTLPTLQMHLTRIKAIKNKMK